MEQNCNAKGIAELQEELHSTMICDIAISGEDLDHCVEAHKVVCIVLKRCVDVEEKLDCWMFWMSVGKRLILCGEP